MALSIFQFQHHPMWSSGVTNATPSDQLDLMLSWHALWRSLNQQFTPQFRWWYQFTWPLQLAWCWIQPRIQCLDQPTPLRQSLNHFRGLSLEFMLVRQPSPLLLRIYPRVAHWLKRSISVLVSNWCSHDHGYQVASQSWTTQQIKVNATWHLIPDSLDFLYNVFCIQN